MLQGIFSPGRALLPANGLSWYRWCQDKAREI